MRYLLIFSFLVASISLLPQISPAEALWTFDGYNPTAVIVSTASTADTITPRITVRDNLTLTYSSSTKTYYFIITASPTRPTSIPTTKCTTSLITSSSLPCKIEFKFGDTGANILAGSDSLSATAEKKAGPFSANSTYYIFGKINQDDAGNSGQISSTPLIFNPTPPAKVPFIQTKEGDVHTNEGITNPGGR